MQVLISRLVWYVPALLWWGVMVYCLWLMPAGQPSGIPYFDKLGHFALFAAWAVLLTAPALWRSQPLRQLMPAVLGACLLWAVGSELGQALLTETRSAEVMDAVADMVGALTGVMLAAHGIALWRARV
ncbi:VanZ family protein [Vogesella sp. XCS3]|uniref:VanZ family protein n=1 Tax=Vogesella sp. XCS3 TaxID=2877939 RepID=UPI001D0BC788|nr:VanZ family protein [Vogesella sp. XCS3]UDM17431.1 VanZ family protein [Vogesella sp. XCS3]